ncbi:hypothetical protein M9H77_13691 [Catharanthus roseus]|uniref:Uncharacterized protein n=1 Tax=Catharanthus roseus TaxID=4058 RepID=A0ACC0BKW2_CATRO|nr:hypothetical protein M9H77_13691 [Catharanthus roseus]
MTEHITAVTQMVSDEPSMLYTTVNNDEDEVDELDGDDAVSSQSESDDDNGPEEGELQTPINPVNPLGMRFVDKMQAISAVCKWFISHINLSSKFISMSISHLVANDPEIPVSNIIQEVQRKWVKSRYLCTGDIFATNVQKTYQANFHLVLSENFWRDAPFNLTFYPPNMKKERGRKQEIRILPQDMADVACRDIIEKNVITPDRGMYKFHFLELL